MTASAYPSILTNRRVQSIHFTPGRHRLCNNLSLLRHGACLVNVGADISIGEAEQA
jgi:hypothetical protein